VKLPCEYCKAPVDADLFIALCVPPCCQKCVYRPLWRATGCFVFVLVCLAALWVLR